MTLFFNLAILLSSLVRLPVGKVRNSFRLTDVGKPIRILNECVFLSGSSNVSMGGSGRGLGEALPDLS
jgi:hypothetical protein